MIDAIQLPWPADWEVWKPALGFPNYDVSTSGNVRSWAVRCWGGRAPRSKPLKPYRNDAGYMTCVLHDDSVRHVFCVHRLVLLAFTSHMPDTDEQVRHLDGNPSNNSINNLAWGNAVQNAHDRWRHGTYSIGAKNGNARLTENMVQDARTRWRQGESKASIASSLGVSTQNIHFVVTGHSWTHLPWPDGTETQRWREGEKAWRKLGKN